MTFAGDGGCLSEAALEPLDEGVSVSHVSRDAYACWAGKRLPTEALRKRPCGGRAPKRRPFLEEATIGHSQRDEMAGGQGRLAMFGHETQSAIFPIRDLVPRRRRSVSAMGNSCRADGALGRLCSDAEDAHSCHPPKRLPSKRWPLTGCRLAEVSGEP